MLMHIFTGIITLPQLEETPSPLKPGRLNGAKFVVGAFLPNKHVAVVAEQSRKVHEYFLAMWGMP